MTQHLSTQNPDVTKHYDTTFIHTKPDVTLNIYPQKTTKHYDTTFIHTKPDVTKHYDTTFIHTL